MFTFLYWCSSWSTGAYCQSSQANDSSFRPSHHLLSRYALSQLYSLLTRSCVIKYNTGTYKIINTGCIWLCPVSDTGPRRCRLSNWFVRLIFLQVRESDGYTKVTVLIELAHGYSLLLLTTLMHLMHTFIEESLPLESLSWHAKKACAICYCAVVGQSRIKHLTQKAQDSFLPNKKSMHLKIRLTAY